MLAMLALSEDPGGEVGFAAPPQNDPAHPASGAAGAAVGRFSRPEAPSGGGARAEQMVQRGGKRRGKAPPDLVPPPELAHGDRMGPMGDQRRNLPVYA